MCVVIKYPLVLMFSCFVWVSCLVQICSQQQSEYVQLVNYAWVHDAGQQLGQDDFGIIEGKILGCIVDLLAIMDWGNPRDTRNCIPEVLVDTFHFPITKRMNFYEFYNLIFGQILAYIGSSMVMFWQSSNTTFHGISTRWTTDLIQIRILGPPMNGIHFNGA